MKFISLRRLFPRNLRWQLIVGVAAVHAVMMSLFSWDLIRRQESLLLERQREHAASLAETLAMSSAHWLVSHDLIGLRELMEAHKRSPELVFALVVDRNKLVLAHTEKALIGLSVSGFPEHPAMKVFSKKRQLVDVGAPVWMAGQHIGWVRVGIDSAFGNSKFQEIVTSGVFYALAAIGIGTILSWFLGSKVITRLHSIQNAIGQIKAGDRGCRIELEGEDEAALLAKEFNHALDTIFLREDQLHNKKEELKELNRQLELLIEDRTRQLNESLMQTQKNEKNLILLTEQLTRSNDELEKFAYVASHDLKAPLRGIKNLAQWLQDDLRGIINDKGERYLQLLANRVERMEGLLDGLLQYSRLGRIDMDVEQVDTAKLLEDTLQLLSISEKFTVHIPAEMPTFDAVKVPLEMVFRNLINNALKHHDREKGVISISVEDANDFYAFRVEDDGPGIAPEFHQKIFTIFQTLRPRDEVEGSGMGLALVKKAVEQQGGTITLHSNPGEARGAAFTFTWPKKPVVL